MSVQDVVIVGASGFGREVIEIFKDQNKIDKKWNILGFVDDNPTINGKTINGFPVLGNVEWLVHNNDAIGCVIAVGEPKVKKQIVEKLEKSRVKFLTAIHPSVIMSEFIEIGEGTIICAGTIMTVNIKIGKHVIINLDCTIGHDVLMDDYVSLMPSVNVSGHVHLKNGVYMGTGSSVIQDRSIGEWSTVGAGAVVVSDLPGNIVVVGVPAKPIKSK
jgi:sugar O-acyltransferase (sialic acid O-acetyltransferase NeuD family)